MMKKWSIKRLEQMPSANEFSSQIEPHNMPVSIGGCVSDWAAINKWNPNTGGLDYLQVQVGSSVVEAMLSRLGPLFYGDIRSHDRISLSFSSFINLCKKGRGIQTDATGLKQNQDGCYMLEYDSTEGLSSYLEAGSQIYLAQVPIINREKKGEFPLQALLEDIYTPRFLEPDDISSINLWMNKTHSRSSTHYDPHHNLLCVVVGRKQVLLWPPSATQFLYPMPVCGEASNHSAVDFVHPDFKVHPRAKHAWDHCQKVVLHAGDALFIPEGWFHQVDSDDLTIAVNFWWPSKIMLAMQTHMDAYYLHRIISRLVDREKEQIIKAVSVIQHNEEETNNINRNSLSNSDVEETENKKFEASAFAGQCTGSTSYYGYNLKEKSYSLLQDDMLKDASDRVVSFSEDCCTSGVTFIEQNQSPNEWEKSLQKTENKSSTVAVCSIEDSTIHPSYPQEISDIVYKEQNDGAMVCRSEDLKSCSSNPTSSGCNLHGVKSQNIYTLQDLDASQSQLLNALISNVHTKMGGAIQIDPQSLKVTDQAPDQEERSAFEFQHFGSSVVESLHLYSVEDDVAAKILGHLKPSTVRKLLLVMVNQFPRTLEALIIHGLSPTAAEILTQKFDQMDKETSKHDQEEFYRLFYSVFDDQHASMEAILNGKECFAFLALKNVMELYLGLNCERPKS